MNNPLTATKATSPRMTRFSMSFLVQGRYLILFEKRRYKYPRSSELAMSSLSFSGLLAESWHTYIANFTKIWRIYIFLFIPSMFFALSEYFFADSFSGAGSLAIWFAFGIAIIFTLLVSIAYYLQIRNVIQGKDESIQRLLSQATPLFLPYVLTSLLSMVLLAVGYVLFIIPGLVLTFYWIFIREAVVFREKKFMAAMDYSFSLVRGRWWKVLGYFLGFAVITMIPQWVLALATSAIGVLGALITMAGVFFVSAWITIAQVMLFFALERTAESKPTQVPTALKKAKVVKKKAKRSSKKVTKKAKKKSSKKAYSKPASKKASTKKKSKRKRR